MIVWNCVRTTASAQPPQPSPPTSVARHLDDADSERLPRSRVSDGVGLSKLLAALDPDYSFLDCIFTEPTSDSEKKWNIRKSIEFLIRKKSWPVGVVIDPYLLFDGRKSEVVKLYDAISMIYANKFKSQSALLVVKDTLGLD
jgi:hypothetical protein